MKTTLVTGANSGLGKECARQLASIDGVKKIYLACRNKSKADTAKADLEASTGKQIFEVVVMDTSDLASVRKAVGTLDHIDAMVMNAGGPLVLDVMPEYGVTRSFAVNVLGHVVLTESLLEAGKLSGSLAYVSTEVVRGIPGMGAKRVVLDDYSVEDFKSVADGSLIKAIKSKDPQMESYGLVKLVGTLWTSYLARQHPSIRFVSVSPGGTSGTNVYASTSKLQELYYTVGTKLLYFFGMTHGVEAGAKRYVDVLTDTKTYKSGAFYASAKGASGEIADQAELFMRELNDTKIQDNANEAIHAFLK